MSQIILTSLFNKLTAVQTAGTVYALVNGQVFQIEAPQATEMPLVVFAMTNESTTAFMSSATASMHQSDVEFAIYSKASTSVVNAMAIEAALFLLLHKASITPSDASYSTIELICNSRGVPTITVDSVRIDTTYRIFATKQS